MPTPNQIDGAIPPAPSIKFITPRDPLAKARQLGAQLCQRYPGVVVLVEIQLSEDGILRQRLIYFAPEDVLRRHGLLTERMLAVDDWQHKRRAFDGLSNGEPVGNGWSLDNPASFYPAQFVQSLPDGSRQLTIYVDSRPRERKRMRVADAVRALRPFRLPRRGRKQ